MYLVGKLKTKITLFFMQITGNSFVVMTRHPNVTKKFPHGRWNNECLLREPGIYITVQIKKYY